MRVRICLFLLVMAASTGVSAQPGQQVPSSLLQSRWPARWITFPEDAGNKYGVYYFRKDFQLSSVNSRQLIHISADNRYKLFINGTYVANGPARGDALNWRFESLDISPFLQAGKNSISVIVWNYGPFRPVAQHSVFTGLILTSNGQLPVETDSTWRVRQDTAYSPLTIDVHHQYYVVGPGEFIDMRLHPFNWMNDDLSGIAWKKPRILEQGTPVRGLEAYGAPAAHLLVPRPIPMMEEKKQRFAALRRAMRIDKKQNMSLSNSFIEGEQSLTIPPHQHIQLLLDQGHLTNAYPVLTVSGGKNTGINIIYAESLVDDTNKKGNRNTVEGKHIYGNRDSLIVDGGDHRIFESLWWRTFRYIQLDIFTRDEALVLNDFHSIFTGYPFREEASFQSDYPRTAEIWETGWRTQRLCAGETFFDCPYYEQLQYIGDSRIQGLVSTYVSGDTVMLRNALTLMNDSRMSFGLTQSRYPSYQPQFIPTFSLVYLAMIHDYWSLCQDDALIRSLLPGTIEILDWFENHIDSTNMIRKPEWWNFVDWVESWRGGIPPGVDSSYSSVVNLNFTYTIQQIAELYDTYDMPEIATHYRDLARRVNTAVWESCYSPDRQLIADTPAKQSFSQHTNALGILNNLYSTDDSRRVMNDIQTSQNVALCSYYFTFYLVEAMQKAGMADDYIGTLGPWENMLDRGLTTFAEAPEPTRSDCHAWSASPLYYFLSLVCGIHPGSPGFKTVIISPELGHLKEVSAELPHRLGKIKVDLQQKSTGKLIGEIYLPTGLEGDFEWHGFQQVLHSGLNQIRTE